MDRVMVHPTKEKFWDPGEDSDRDREKEFSERGLEIRKLKLMAEDLKANRALREMEVMAKEIEVEEEENKQKERKRKKKKVKSEKQGKYVEMETIAKSDPKETEAKVDTEGEEILEKEDEANLDIEKEGNFGTRTIAKLDLKEAEAKVDSEQASNLLGLETVTNEEGFAEKEIGVKLGSVEERNLEKENVVELDIRKQNEKEEFVGKETIVKLEIETIAKLDAGETLGSKMESECVVKGESVQQASLQMDNSFYEDLVERAERKLSEVAQVIELGKSGRIDVTERAKVLKAIFEVSGMVMKLAVRQIRLERS